MLQAAETSQVSIQQILRRIAPRRNTRTALIVLIAFIGGPFGLTWLAISSSTVFLALMLLLLKQRDISS